MEAIMEQKNMSSVSHWKCMEGSRLTRHVFSCDKETCNCGVYRIDDKGNIVSVIDGKINNSMTNVVEIDLSNIVEKKRLEKIAQEK